MTPAPVAAHLQLFGQFVGTWETRIAHLGPDGSPVSEVGGEWEFSYGLDGRAVLDVWRVPARTARTAGGDGDDDARREVGLCVRIWDLRLQLWRFTFHSTATTTVLHLYAHGIGADIVMERAEPDRLERWVFHDIRPDTFSWRSEVSRDGGPWRPVQTLTARRTTAT